MVDPISRSFNTSFSNTESVVSSVASSSENNVGLGDASNYSGSRLVVRPTTSLFTDSQNMLNGNPIRTPVSLIFDSLSSLLGYECPSPNFTRWMSPGPGGGLVSHTSTNSDELGPLDWQLLGFLPEAWDMSRLAPPSPEPRSLDSLRSVLLANFETIPATEPEGLESLLQDVLSNFLTLPDDDFTFLTSEFRSWLVFHILYAPPTPEPLSLDSILREMIEAFDTGRPPPTNFIDLTDSLREIVASNSPVVGRELSPKGDNLVSPAWMTPPNDSPLFEDSDSVQ
jgi:hypothetical protein